MYRQTYEIPDELGTMMNVMQMVFGNKGDDSATGVCFSRDPSTGERGICGEFLVNAQGGRRRGIRLPRPLDDMRGLLPAAFAELEQTVRRLERHYRDVQDIEFTVERGSPVLLVPIRLKRGRRGGSSRRRDGRGGAADREDAISRIDPAQIDHLLHPMIDPGANFVVVAKGLAASPGLRPAMPSSARTPRRRAAGRADVILVRWETSPDDIHGLIAAKESSRRTEGSPRTPRSSRAGWASPAWPAAPS